MSTQKKAKLEAEQEKQRRERERREFKEAQELEALKRAFKRMDKKGDGRIDVEELQQELKFLGHSVKDAEAAKIIWEVDDDADEAVAMLYQRFGNEIVDERVREFLGDGLDEKNISFTKFAAIQRASSKRRTLQKSSGGATMVPQVKGLSYVMDPTLAHLL